MKTFSFHSLPRQSLPILAAVHLGFFRDWSNLIPTPGDADLAYFTFGVSHALVLKLWGEVVGISLVLWLSCIFLKKHCSPGWRECIDASAMVLGLSPLLLWGVYRSFLGESPWGLMVALTAMTSLLVMARNQPMWFTRISSVFGILFLPFIVLTLFQSVYYADGTKPMNLSTTSKKGIRVVWVLFDALDPFLLGPEKWEGFHYPNFRRLRDESLWARSHSPGPCTLYSIPGYLTGGQITGARISEQVQWRDEKGSWKSWSDSRPIFKELPEIASEVIGFFHPYCRELGRWLTKCKEFSAYQFSGPSLSLMPFSLDRESAVAVTNHQNMVRNALDSLKSERSPKWD